MSYDFNCPHCGYGMNKDQVDIHEDVCVFIPSEINTAIQAKRRDRGDLPIGVSYRKQTGRFVSRMRRANKDIHIGIYSTPNEAFINYKKEKESYLKVLAEKWKADIDDRAYKALINYKVDETD